MAKVGFMDTLKNVKDVVTNWADAHPDDVSAIFVTATLCTGMVLGSVITKQSYKTYFNGVSGGLKLAACVGTGGKSTVE